MEQYSILSWEEPKPEETLYVWIGADRVGFKAKLQIYRLNHDDSASPHTVLTVGKQLF